MKDPRVKGDRLVYDEWDGSKVSMQGNKAWRHRTDGITENVPIESFGVERVDLSRVGSGATRATQTHRRHLGGHHTALGW